MLRSVIEFQGNAVHGTDEENVGTIYEFYFHDNRWAIRYLVVDTGNWLSGRRVLISPVAISRVEGETQMLFANLTRTQIEQSPNIDTDLPISRQRELEYLQYYGWPNQWGMDPTVATAYPKAVSQVGLESALDPANAPQGDPHLRRTREVIGYYIHAKDGDIGHVEDFLVDDETWDIRYMVIDTRNWWPGKKILVAPSWITEIRWTESKVYVDLSREQIKNGPEFDPTALSRQYEEQLYKHYDRPRYWE